MYTQLCSACLKQFIITDKEEEYYGRIQVPCPTHCENCRKQRRWAWRNERSLYTRTCDLCTQSIVSIYSPDKDLTVYCNTCWWSDRWEAKDYGREVDFSRPFFEQWNELNRVIPKLALINDDGVQSSNCAFTNDLAFGKDCYFSFCSWQLENCYYATWASGTKYGVDVYGCLHSQYLYESLDCVYCTHSVYLIDSSRSDRCFFSQDLRNCQDCILSFGLRNRQYCIENKQYSKEEYERYVQEYLKLERYSVFTSFRSRFLELRTKALYKYAHIQNSVECEGDYLTNCKNAQAFDSHGAEDGRYLTMTEDSKHSYDVTNSASHELCYESITCDNGYNAKFTIFSWKCKNVTYTNDCHASEDLWGCVSLKKERYCVLNKAYTKEEYELLVIRLINHMKETGEWGEFFPMQYSPFAYNETLAQFYYPLSEAEIHARGLLWRIKEQKDYVATGSWLPDNIFDTEEATTQGTFGCTNTTQNGICGKQFRITPHEYAFYMQMRLPLPRCCPECRHNERMHLRNPRTLWTRQCMCTSDTHSHTGPCTTTFRTSYGSDRSERVYCTECYEKETY